MKLLSVWGISLSVLNEECLTTLDFVYFSVIKGLCVY